MDRVQKIDQFKNKILRPLSEYYYSIEQQRQYYPLDEKKYRKGLAICHGYNHSNELISKLRFIKYWYMVDININTHPDYVADASSEEDMSYFPNDFFDCILTEHCRVVNNDDKPIYGEMIRNCHRILKKNGVLCSTELPGLFFWFVNDDEFNSIESEIKAIIGGEINEMAKKYIENLTKNMTDMYKDETPETIERIIKKYVTERSFYYHIMMGHYDGPRKEKMNDYIKKTMIKYTVIFLDRHNFTFIGIKGRFLLAKPKK